MSEREGSQRERALSEREGTQREPGTRTVLRGARWPGDVAFTDGRIDAVGSVPPLAGDDGGRSATATSSPPDWSTPTTTSTNG